LKTKEPHPLPRKKLHGGDQPGHVRQPDFIHHPAPPRERAPPESGQKEPENDPDENHARPANPYCEQVPVFDDAAFFPHLREARVQKFADQLKEHSEVSE
jgi:hypothetical protein